MIIVSNTTPLSELAKVGKLELLRELFGTIFISQEVYDEVIQGKHPATSSVPSAKWIEVVTLGSPIKALELQTAFKLDLGEAATTPKTRSLRDRRVGNGRSNFSYKWAILPQSPPRLRE